MKVTAEPGPGEDDPDLALPQPAIVLLAVLGRRWSPHVLYLLGQQPARFTELQRAVPGISATSLNDRLRDLIAHGLVLRHAFPGPPMTSSYEATETGRMIGQHLIGMVASTGITTPPRQPNAQWRS
jgi:DNA-binding HxlR family transcriptional regulator